MHKKKRVLSAAVAAALCVAAILPAFSGVQAAADTVDGSVLQMPTKLSAPTLQNVYEAGAQNPTMYLQLAQSPDYLDFAEAMLNNVWSSDNNRMECPYGAGYGYYECCVQTDYALDDGTWQYTTEWDTLLNGFGDYNAYNQSFHCNQTGVEQNGSVRLIDATHLVDSFAGTDDFFYSRFRDSYTAEADGSYRFNTDEHQLSVRSRYCIRIYSGGFYANDSSGQITASYLYSDWSDTLSYGKGAGAQLTVPETLTAPTLTDLSVFMKDGATSHTMTFRSEEPADVLALCADTGEQNAASGLSAVDTSVLMYIEASVDGENWVNPYQLSAHGTRLKTLDLYDLWAMLYKSDTNTTYSMPTTPLYLRAKYSASVLTGGTDDALPVEQVLESDWSEVVSTTLVGADAFAYTVSHTGTGYGGMNDTVIYANLKDSTVPEIRTPYVTGCYVQSVTVNGKVYYDKDDAATQNLLLWSLNHDYFLFNAETDPTFTTFTQNLDIVVTYGGTPVEEHVIALSYTAGGYISPGTSVEFNTATGLYEDFCDVSGGASATFTFYANDGYTLSSVLIDGVENAAAVTNKSCTLSNVTQGHTIEATFTRSAYEVSVYVTNLENGTVTYPADFGDNTQALISMGGSCEFTATPRTDDTTGITYELLRVLVNDVDVLEAPTSTAYTLNLSDVQEDTTVFFVFSTDLPTYYTIDARVGNDGIGGTLNYAAANIAGLDATVSWTAQPGYVLEKIEVDGVALTDVTADSYTFSAIDADHTLVVYFAELSVPEKYTLTVSSNDPSGLNTVSPIGVLDVAAGSTQTVAFHAQDGYFVSALSINGVAYSADEIAALGGSYTFENIHSDCSFAVTFAPQTCTVQFVDYNGNVLSTQAVAFGGAAVPPTEVPSFDDAATGAHYHESGWSGSYTNVQKDTTVTAIYATEAYTIEYLPTVLEFDITDGDRTISTDGMQLRQTSTYLNNPIIRSQTTVLLASVLNVTLSETSAAALYGAAVVGTVTAAVNVSVTLSDGYVVPAGTFEVKISKSALTTETTTTSVSETPPPTDTTTETTTSVTTTDTSDTGSDTTTVTTATTDTTSDTTVTTSDTTGTGESTTETTTTTTTSSDTTTTTDTTTSSDTTTTTDTTASTDTTTTTATEFVVQFYDYDGTLVTECRVAPGEDATAPQMDTHYNADNDLVQYNGWDTKFTEVQSDLIVTACCTIQHNELAGRAYVTTYLLADGELSIDLSGLALKMTTTEDGVVTDEIRNLILLQNFGMIALSADTAQAAYTGENNVTITVSLLQVDGDATVLGTFDITVIRLGDTDGSNAVDANDAVAILRAYATAMIGQETGLTAAQKKSADVDHNGTIDAQDASKVLAYYAAAIISPNPTWGTDSKAS